VTSGAKVADLLRLIAAHAGSMRADCVHDARTGELDAEATLKGCRGKANFELNEERALRSIRPAAELKAAASAVEQFEPDAMEALGHHDGTLSDATRLRIAAWLRGRATAHGG